MTNGELIQKDFNCEVCEPIPEDDIIHVIFSDKSDSAIGFDWSWWNMEYKEPTTKNDLGVDCIDRAQAQTEIEMNASRYTIAKERGGIGQVEWSDQLIKVSDAVDIIRNLPAVTPQEPKEKCKWIKYDYRTIFPKDHISVDSPFWRIPENRVEILYCPHCGKEIEVEE